MKIILVYDEEKQEEIEVEGEIHDQDWERDTYRIGCMVSRALAKHYLEEKDKGALGSASTSFQVHDTLTPLMA